VSTGLEPGRLVGGRYRLDVLLARGGMAEVWQATDQTLGRAVAVKILHPHLAGDAEFRDRFRREAVAVARLVHPNIVAIYDTCRDDGADAIVMELVRGRTLRDFLDERHRLEPVEVVHIGIEVAAALDCAHRAGVIHRDVKPANILLSDDGRVLVTDFGIAKVLDGADRTTSSNLLGTVKYVAPEQVDGLSVDARTDVYAVGAVLYECLAGVPPFLRDSPGATALARLNQVPQRPSQRTAGVSASLDAPIMRALATRPADRFDGADELRATLQTVALEAPCGDPTIVVTLDPIPSSFPIQNRAPLEAPRVAARRRSATGVVIALLITTALVIVALLVSSTRFGRQLFDAAAPTTTVVTVGPPATSELLLWFTDLGAGPPYRMTVTDVILEG